MAQSSKPATAAKQPIGNLKVGGFVGDACNDHAACRPGLQCLGLFGDGQGAYPQGMCSSICPKDTCFDDAAYPYSRCVTWRHEPEAICMIGCNDQGRCDRVGYECDRVDRSDGQGTRYVCVPRPGSAANALEAAKIDGAPQPPPGTTTIPAVLPMLKGTPAEFGARSFVPPPTPTSIPARAQMEANAAAEGEDQLEGAEAAPSEASAEATSSAPDATQHARREEVRRDAEAAPPREAESISLVSVVIIVVVGVITVLSLLRMLTSGRVGGMWRSMRDAADDETPLERIRRADRKKKVRSGVVDETPEVRVTRRLPTRPLRATTTHVSAGREDAPVIPRGEAVARDIVRPEPEPPPVEETSEKDAAVQTDPPSTPDTSPPPVEAEPAGPAVFSADDLAGYTAPRERSPGRAAPVRPADWMAPPDPDYPLMDVGRPLATKLWAGAKAARAFGAPRGATLQDQLPTLIEMDEFVAPLPIDMVLELLDELLGYAESLRQRKGYEAIVYIETDPRKTWFRRGPEGKIRIQHALDAFSKPALAIDVMRRKGYSTTMKVSDAHLLSLVHLGRYLLGSAAHDDVMLSIDALSNSSARFSHEERRLVEFLLAPEEHEQLQRLSSSRRKEAGVAGGKDTARFSAGGGKNPPAAPIDALLPCPGCASEVAVGDLACRHCGVALHPRPAFCSSCGTRNILLADGSPQNCLNFACGAELLHGATQADVEGRRLSIIAELLSSFDEFRKLPGRGENERYEALTQGRRVEVWQLAADRGTILVEDDRPHYELSDRVTLPHRCVERSGVQFVIYDPPTPARHPLYSLGGELLAEKLLSLVDEVHQAKLRLPALAFEDLAVSESGELCLLHGHVLRSATAPTPRLTDTRFSAPELARQALATERSDLYTIAAIWYYALAGTAPVPPLRLAEHEAFIGVPELTLEWMKQCLREASADRPESARHVLMQLRRRRRLDDLV